MPHIHTKPGEHDHTASAYVVRVDYDEPKLLLHLHKKLHKYIQFGGHIETTETPWQAVVHELREESGYEMSQLKVLQPKQRLVKGGRTTKLHPVPIYHNTHHFSEDHFHTDVAYAVVARDVPANLVGNEESGKIIELTRQELLDLPADQTLEDIRESGIFIFDVCLKEWEEVNPSVFD